MFPSFSFPVCCLSSSVNGDALCSGRNNPYWERPGPNTIGRPSPIGPLSTTGADQTWRQKPTGLQQGESSNVWHRDAAWQRCVWPQSTSLFSAVWERVLSFRAETLQEMAFICKTTCWKWYTAIGILSPSHPHLLSCNHVALLPPQLFFFLNVVLSIQVSSTIFMRNLVSRVSRASCG